MKCSVGECNASCLTGRNTCYRHKGSSSYVSSQPQARSSPPRSSQPQAQRSIGSYAPAPFNASHAPLRSHVELDESEESRYVRQQGRELLPWDQRDKSSPPRTVRPKGKRTITKSEGHIQRNAAAKAKLPLPSGKTDLNKLRADLRAKAHERALHQDQDQPETDEARERRRKFFTDANGEQVEEFYNYDEYLEDDA